jgi:hypothetical protein
VTLCLEIAIAVSPSCFGATEESIHEVPQAGGFYFSAAAQFARELQKTM